MRIEDLNRPVLALDDAHPTKRFLIAFIECLENCVGQELGLGEDPPIDQQWTSAVDGRTWKFSGFAYMFLAFDIVLDGFLTDARHLTASEIGAAEELPKLRTMMHECAAAARRDDNSEVVEMTDEVLQMLDRWEEYLNYRRAAVAHS